MEYRGINRRAALLLIVLVLVIVFAIVWWINRKPLETGNNVPVTSQPYHHLAYTKLAYQGDNFVGDIFLLDVNSGRITQLTQGGETSAVRWLSSESLAIIERPRGSVINPFVLNVNQGTLRESVQIDSDVNTINRSPDAQRFVIELIKSNTWDSEGYTVNELVNDQARLLLRLPDASSLPVWLPDSATILYDTQNGEVCLHDVDNDSRDCLAGTQSRLSPSITPLLVAYTTSINGVSQLCVAHIENRNFSHTQCYDQNDAQITTLLWRP